MHHWHACGPQLKKNPLRVLEEDPWIAILGPFACRCAGCVLVCRADVLLNMPVNVGHCDGASDSRDGVELAAALVFCFGIGPIGAYCQWQLGGY